MPPPKAHVTTLEELKAAIDAAASDRGIEKIVADIIGFCLIRQSFTVPIVCFHSKSI